MIAIIDYGVGNLRSVEKALQHAYADTHITSDSNVILNASAVVLPGVGAFGQAMEKMKQNGMVDIVKQVISSNKPFLGICLGMQMLFDYSEEGGEGDGGVEGLGILKGSIKRLPQDMKLKVPHMGWNKVKLEKDIEFFRGIEDNSYFYFVHSYYLDSVQRDIVSGTVNYGIEFDVAIQAGNVYGTQFHPEKSGKTGLKLLENFVNLIEKERVY